MKRKIVIIGGVAGGATAAARLRRIGKTLLLLKPFLFLSSEGLC